MRNEQESSPNRHEKVFASNRGKTGSSTFMAAEWEKVPKIVEDFSGLRSRPLVSPKLLAEGRSGCLVLYWSVVTVGGSHHFTPSGREICTLYVNLLAMSNFAFRSPTPDYTLSPISVV